MNEELILAAMNLFDSAEKWNSFCELMNKNDQIQRRWWKNLQTVVYQREMKNPHPEWDIHIWNDSDIKWYIKGESPNSLVIHFWSDGFRLYSDYGDLDPVKVTKLMRYKVRYTEKLF